MTALLDPLRERLAHAEARLAYVRYVAANSEMEDEAHDLNTEAAALVTEIADLRERIKAIEANEQRAEKGAGR